MQRSVAHQEVADAGVAHRRNGLDKDARYGAQSPFERLKAQCLTRP
jgi:hypothetical protein